LWHIVAAVFLKFCPATNHLSVHVTTPHYFRHLIFHDQAPNLRVVAFFVWLAG
jgi:hypothetical protein